MKKEQIPNVLTIGRILFIPLFILILTLGHSQGSHLLAAIIFAVASITDYLDGYLARKWNVVSNFGKFADPMADKLLVMSAFIMLIELGMAPAWVVAIIDVYKRQGLGDVKTKRYLLEILERELGPIRERRIEFAKDMGEVYNMLQKGSEKAREVAGETLSEVKGAMGLNYFKL